MKLNLFLILSYKLDFKAQKLHRSFEIYVVRPYLDNPTYPVGRVNISV